MDFVHLHVHSNYSLLQGAFTLAEVVDAAARLEMPAVALTDTNGLYGALLFYQAARRAGIRPIIGTEIVHGSEQCICLAADRKGYANLCRIVTEQRLHCTEEDCTYDLARSIATDAEGLFVLSATPSLLQRLRGEIPPGRLYAELRADEPGSFETRCPSLRGCTTPGGPAPRSVAPADTAERLGIPLAATANVNFLRPEDRQTHAVLGAIRENVSLKSLLDRGRMLAGPHSTFMTAQRVAERLSGCQGVRQAMRNTARIAEACELELELGVPHFPRADLPPDVPACRRLREAAYAGARRRYGKLTDRVRARLDRELDVIARLAFCDYFLVVHDIVEFAEREGIPHVGRGSAANSIVAYSLGISAVDPLKFDLYFERFLNEFRTDVPDIDIDFCWRRRDDVIRYVYERHGDERVAMVSTHSTLRARAAFRDVARVMGLPLDEINTHSKVLPHYGASSVEEAMQMFPEMADFPIAREPWRTVVGTALKIDGYVRHLGIHLGGLVVGDRPLTWYTPLERSTKGIVVTQYEMKSIEKTGLVKMDLLGQRSLSIVAEAARNAERRGARIDVAALPDRDPLTASILQNGRTMGCFQIESPGMRQLLQMLRAESIMDLIQGLSLIRPGPSSSGMKHAFIRRKRGEEPTVYPTPLLEDALSATHGVMLYQEDILRVAEAVAGFTLAEGDELRKHISKFRAQGRLGDSKERFIRGALGRGVDEAVAEDIWSQIEGFAAYSYCKAHASTYGHISYQASYLKAHYPAEFLAGVIANKAGFYDARTYFEEARRFNVKILPPCVNRSDAETQPEDRAIRPGLEFVRSLGAAAVKQVLEQRVLRPFESLEDFCARVRLPREALENMALCGCFDSFGLTRPTLMMKLERILSAKRSPLPVGARLFEPEPSYAASVRRPPPPPPPVRVPDQPPYSIGRRILHELRILGFSHSGHPLQAWGDALRGLRLTPSFEMKRHAGRRVRFAGWLITTRRAVTKNHEYMKFLTLEDRYGTVEAVMFPDVYKKCGAAMDSGGCYYLEGEVKDQHGAVSLVARDVRPVPLPSPA